uniref:Uncharacterized protein n=1 Tax=Meloidogyne enterolobii TaxID=390850 RepID=A0A6V7V666_MELEN|nr:unnamed protein product [Meloidogyne enterolobii]
MMFTYWPPVKHCFICPPNTNHHYYHPSSSLPPRCAISLGDLPDHIFLQILNDQKQILNSHQQSSSSSSSTQSFPQYNKIMKKSTILSDEKLNEEWEGNDNRIEILQKRTSQKSVGTQTGNNNIPFKIEEEFEDNEENSKIICSQIAQSLLDIADRWAKPQQEIPTKSFWLFGWLQMKVFRLFG